MRASGLAVFFYLSLDGESPWPRQLREPLATQFFIKLYFCSRREPLASSAACAPGYQLFRVINIKSYDESPWPRQLREPLAA